MMLFQTCRPVHGTSTVVTISVSRERREREDGTSHCRLQMGCRRSRLLAMSVTATYVDRDTDTHPRSKVASCSFAVGVLYRYRYDDGVRLPYGTATAQPTKKCRRELVAPFFHIMGGRCSYVIASSSHIRVFLCRLYADFEMIRDKNCVLGKPGRYDVADPAHANHSYKILKFSAVLTVFARRTPLFTLCILFDCSRSQTTFHHGFSE